MRGDAPQDPQSMAKARLLETQSCRSVPATIGKRLKPNPWSCAQLTRCWTHLSEPGRAPNGGEQRDECVAYGSLERIISTERGIAYEGRPLGQRNAHSTQKSGKLMTRGRGVGSSMERTGG